MAYALFRAFATSSVQRSLPTRVDCRGRGQSLGLRGGANDTLTGVRRTWCDQIGAMAALLGAGYWGSLVGNSGGW